MSKIEKLLAWLDDERVVSKICEIIEKRFPELSQSAVSNAERRNGTAHDTADDIARDQTDQPCGLDKKNLMRAHSTGPTISAQQTKELLQRLKGIQHDLTEEVTSARKRCSALKTWMNKLAAAVKRLSQYSELTACYDAYKQLPAAVRDELTNVVSQSDPVAFVVSGTQGNTLLGIWDYLKTRLDELQPTTIETLLRILHYFIFQYNSVWNAPVYEIMDAECGKLFDDERHARTSDSSQYVGRIEQVLLPGIWNLRKNRAERRSIVRYRSGPGET